MYNIQVRKVKCVRHVEYDISLATDTTAVKETILSVLSPTRLVPFLVTFDASILQQFTTNDPLSKNLC